MNNNTFYQIHSDIFCTHDGPVTQFVAINRAMELATSKEYSTEDIANVLYEGLQGFQELPSTEFNCRFN